MVFDGCLCKVVFFFRFCLSFWFVLVCLAFDACLCVTCEFVFGLFMVVGVFGFVCCLVGSGCCLNLFSVVFYVDVLRIVCCLFYLDSAVLILVFGYFRLNLWYFCFVLLACSLFVIYYLLVY